MLNEAQFDRKNYADQQGVIHQQLLHSSSH